MCSHDFKYHLCIIDSQMYISSPHLIPAFLPHISCSLHTSTYMPNHHFWLTVFLMDSHSSAFVLPFLCKWHASLCNRLLSPKTLEVSLDSFLSLQPKCNSSTNYIGSNFKLYTKIYSLLMTSTPTILIQTTINCQQLQEPLTSSTTLLPHCPLLTGNLNLYSQGSELFLLYV